MIRFLRLPHALFIYPITIWGIGIFVKCAFRSILYFSEIVPYAIDLMPAGVHIALSSIRNSMEVIGPSGCVGKPADLHIASLIKVIPFYRILVSQPLPAGHRIGTVCFPIPPAYLIPNPGTCRYRSAAGAVGVVGTVTTIIPTAWSRLNYKMHCDSSGLVVAIHKGKDGRVITNAPSYIRLNHITAISSTCRNNDVLR